MTSPAGSQGSGPATGPEQQGQAGPATGTAQEGTGQAQDPATGADDAAALGDAGRRALEAERQKARDAETARKKAEKDLRDLQARTQTEDERKITEAEDRGRAEVRSSFGERLVKAEVRAAAAKRNPAFDVEPVLEDLNLSKYLSDDGEVNEKGISDLVSKFVPEPAGDGRPRGYVGPGPQGTRTVQTTSLDPRALDRAQVEADLAAGRRK